MNIFPKGPVLAIILCIPAVSGESNPRVSCHNPQLSAVRAKDAFILNKKKSLIIKSPEKKIMTILISLFELSCKGVKVFYISADTFQEIIYFIHTFTEIFRVYYKAVDIIIYSAVVNQE